VGKTIIWKIINDVKFLADFIENTAHVEKMVSVRVLKLRLPDFLGIGAQKAGTTWLHSNFRAHPQIYIPSKKELHYFDNHYYHSLKSYSDYFREGKNKIMGEITPDYGILSEDRVKVIRKIMPEIKLILLLRNPIDRAWSHAIMDFMVLQKRPYESIKPEEFLQHFCSIYSMSYGDYNKTLSVWLNLFPKESLYIGYFREINNDPQKLLTGIFKHLNVSTDLEWDKFPMRKKIFSNPEIQIPQVYRQVLEEIYFPKMELLRKDFGIDLFS
jgi:hypothetical protein